MNKIAVLGAGNMGTAVAQMFAKGGHDVRLWDFNPATVEEIRQKGENPNFLPGIKLLPNIRPEADMSKAVLGAQIIIMAVASPYIKKVGATLSKYVKKGQVVGHIVKGLDEASFLTMHDILAKELPASLRGSVVTITGPSIAKEFASGAPTAVVASSKSKAARELVRKALTSETFKVGTSDDYKGAGICSAVKNAYAIAHGMCDGMQFSMNAKAWLLAMSAKEMETITIAYGGKRETVYGINGLGDLIVTCLGDGRNRALGERICKENTRKFVFDEKNGQTFEGVAATASIYKFAKSKRLKTPILDMVYDVLYKGMEPCKKINDFFTKIKLT